jgi:outer membrane lipoprotein-sorting protein
MKQILILTWLLCTFSATAADLSASIKARLTQPEVISGQFEQSKQVAGFKKPLVSKGDFLVVRERGVLWRTLSPFASELKLSRDEIVARQNGEEVFRLNADKEPSVRMINGLLFSLMSGDIAGLNELFHMEGSVSAKSWQLELTPRQATLGKIMRKIELSGDQFVRRIDLDEANGDQTHIRFLAQTPHHALSAEERVHFE